MQNIDDTHRGQQEEHNRRCLSQIGQEDALGDILLDGEAVVLYAGKERLVVSPVLAGYEVCTETDVKHPTDGAGKDGHCRLVDVGLSLRCYQQ